MYKIANLITIALVVMSLTFSAHTVRVECQPIITSVEIIEEPIIEPVADEDADPVVLDETGDIAPIDEKIALIRSYVEEEPVIEYQESSDTTTTTITDQEIELIALVTMAEAEGESEEGKRLVIDTVLNRVDHERFPDTIEEVIYQPSQFSSMWNGRVDRCYVDEAICELVREEIENRTNSEVMFFTAGRYSKYGEPMFIEGNHYFSRYA